MAAPQQRLLKRQSSLDESARRTLTQLKRTLPELHRWYRATARDLPWRRTRDPYPIWVSEVMLQQTQVKTVLPYFARWLDAFPTVQALAAADLQAVLKAWEGLGYYSRARNFHRAARLVVAHHGGCIPATVEEFGALPGVGPYIQAAVLSIAFDQDLAVVDGNVRRVLARLFALAVDLRTATGSRRVDDLAQALLPPGTAAIHNQAVMELGALVCTPRQPSCSSCPVRAACRAARAGHPEQYPARPPTKVIPRRQLIVAVVTDGDGRILVHRRGPSGLLGGMFELPHVEPEPDQLRSPHARRQAIVAELRHTLGIRVEPRDSLPPVRHTYSHFKVTLHPEACALLTQPTVFDGAGDFRWLTPAELSAHPMGRADQRVLAQARGRG